MVRRALRRSGFVPLAPLASGDLVVSAIAAAAGLRDAGNLDLSALVRFFQRQELLVVLDNFEHVVDAAPVVVELLAACPAFFKVLTTSHEVRCGCGASTSGLAPLIVPDEGSVLDLASSEGGGRRSTCSSSGPQPRPDLDLSADLATVAALCRRLEGVQRHRAGGRGLRLLTPQALLRRLEGGRGALPYPGRDVPERHGSVRRAIDWSYDLLAEPAAVRQPKPSSSSGYCPECGICHPQHFERVVHVLHKVFASSGPVNRHKQRRIAQWRCQELFPAAADGTASLLVSSES